MRQVQKLSLQWEDFNVGSVELFKTIGFDSDFKDIALGCSDSNGETLHAHKVILAAFSPVLKDLLKASQPSRQSVAALFMRGMKHKQLSSLLDFIYDGHVQIEEVDLNSFLSIAEDLQIKGLTGDKLRREDCNENTYATKSFKRPIISDEDISRIYQQLPKVYQDIPNIPPISRFNKTEKYVVDEINIKGEPINYRLAESLAEDNKYASQADITLVPDEDRHSVSRGDLDKHGFRKRFRRKAPEVNQLLEQLAANQDSKTFENGLTLVKSKFGGFNLYKDGHSYHVSTCTTLKILWQCRKRKQLDCKSSLTTDLKLTDISRISEHCHEPLKAKKS